MILWLNSMLLTSFFNVATAWKAWWSSGHWWSTSQFVAFMASSCRGTKTRVPSQDCCSQYHQNSIRFYVKSNRSWLCQLETVTQFSLSTLGRSQLSPTAVCWWHCWSTGDICLQSGRGAWAQQFRFASSRDLDSVRCALAWIFTFLLSQDNS